MKINNTKFAIAAIVSFVAFWYFFLSASYRSATGQTVYEIIAGVCILSFLYFGWRTGQKR